MLEILLSGWSLSVRTLIFILCMVGYLLLLGYLSVFVTDKICEKAGNYTKICRIVDISEPHIPDSTAFNRGNRW